MVGVFLRKSNNTYFQNIIRWLLHCLAQGQKSVLPNSTSSSVITIVINNMFIPQTVYLRFLQLYQIALVLSSTLPFPHQILLLPLPTC